ncbi:hypothetical protein BAT_3942 [Bacillus pumilus ATCC 7061]|nr:hypothetical protein BAT_3942 [Bacillus pumilus ATCC 7061]
MKWIMFIRKRKRKTVIVLFPLEIDGRIQLLNLKKATSY